MSQAEHDVRGMSSPVSSRWRACGSVRVAARAGRSQPKPTISGSGARGDRVLSTDADRVLEGAAARVVSSKSAHTTARNAGHRPTD